MAKPTFTPIIAANCRGETPIECIRGNNMGAQSNVQLVSSIIIPRRIRKILTISKITIRLSEILSIKSQIIAGSPIRIKT